MAIPTGLGNVGIVVRCGEQDERTGIGEGTDGHVAEDLFHGTGVVCHDGAEGGRALAEGEVAEEGIDVVAGVFGPHLARAVEFIDEAAAVVVFVVFFEGLDEAPVEVAHVGGADVEAGAEVVVVFVEDADDGGEGFPVDGGGAPVEGCGG